MRALGLVFFLLLSQFLSLHAEARRKTEWALHLDTKLDYTFFPEELGENINKDFYRLELDPNYSWKYEDSWRFYLRPQFVTDPGNKSETERVYFDLTEANIRYKSDLFTVQLGNNLFSWGVTDGYNPLDVINSRQYFDALHSRKMGATSVVFSQNFETWDYELVYIPMNRGATLPGEQSRWLPREVFVPETPDNNRILLLPQNINYHYASRRNLDDALHDNFAFRTQWRGAVDIGLSYYDGVASFPLVRPAFTGEAVAISPKEIIRVDPDVILYTQNYRIRHGGFSLVANYWDVLFKYAGSYTQSVGKDSYLPEQAPTAPQSYLPGWTQENVAGLEKTFTLGTSGLLVAVLQHSFITTEKKNDSNLSFTEIFRNAWMLGGRLSWSEVWSASLSSLYDATHGSHFEEISITRRIGDAWNVSLGGNFIQGNSDTALGVYEKNDSYSLAVSRSF